MTAQEIKENPGLCLRMYNQQAERIIELNKRIAKLENAIGQSKKTQKTYKETIESMQKMDINVAKKKVLGAVSVYHPMHIKVVDGPCRERPVVEARHLAMFMLRRKFIHKSSHMFSFAEIGNAFGGRDHSTVIHACHAVEDLCLTDKEFRFKFEQIESHL